MARKQLTEDEVDKLGKDLADLLSKHGVSGGVLVIAGDTSIHAVGRYETKDQEEFCEGFLDSLELLNICPGCGGVHTPGEDEDSGDTVH